MEVRIDCKVTYPSHSRGFRPPCGNCLFQWAAGSVHTGSSAGGRYCEVHSHIPGEREK